VISMACAGLEPMSWRSRPCLPAVDAERRRLVLKRKLIRRFMGIWFFPRGPGRREAIFGSKFPDWGGRLANNNPRGSSHIRF